MCNRMDNPVEEEYKDGLVKEAEKIESENARDNILQFYLSNKSICDRAYQYYVEYENNKEKYVDEPIRLTPEQFLKQLKPRKILVLTANPIERGILIRWLSEKNDLPLKTYMINSYSYNVYNFVDMNTTEAREVSIIHVSPGITGEDYTRRMINRACRLFQPNCIIALGICYGFNKNKYSIGCVFLSENLTVFRINYRDAEDDVITLEAETEFEKQPTYELVQSIRERIMYTMVRNFLSDERQPLYASMEMGRFLSINSLMSNKKAKQALFEQYGQIKPKPLGGEMEGPGILKADIVQENGFSNWLIVKSICDWGEMKNSLDSDEKKSEQIKDSLQAFAMTNTCSVFDKILADLCEV